MINHLEAASTGGFVVAIGDIPRNASNAFINDPTSLFIFEAPGAYSMNLSLGVRCFSL
jgi:hypothetical protein